MRLKIQIILNLSIVLILSGCADTLRPKDWHLYGLLDDNIGVNINSSVEPSDWDYVDIIHGVSVYGYTGEINDNTLKTPKTIGLRNLIAIGPGFSSLNKFTKVDFSDSVYLTKIENDAFTDKQIEKVFFTDSLTNIGNSAFANNQLTSVTLPNSLTNIGEETFFNNKLTSVTLPNSLTNIGKSAFAYNKLTSVTLGDSLTIIGNHAFYNNQLTSVTLPNSLTTIGKEAFNYNSNLKNILFKGDDPSKITIATTAFDGTHSDLRIHVPKDQLQDYRNRFPHDLACKIVALDKNGNLDPSVTNINCGNPARWTVTNTSDGGSLSRYTGEIKNNTLKTPETIGGKNVTAIGPGFSSSKFTKLDLSASVHLTKIENKTFKLKEIEEVVFPDSLTTIGNYAFSKNKLTSIDLPNSLTTIGNNAFFNNPLTSVTLGDSLTTIGNYAFYENQLTSIDLPNTLTTIGNYAFYKNKLTSVTLKENLTNIGNNAFDKNQLTSIDLPNSITTIGNYAFYKNKLTSVTLKENLTNIGKYAFANNKLTSVTLGDSLTTIGNYAFANNELTSVTLSDNLTNIGKSAFAYNKLTSVILPNSLTNIGDNAFNKNKLTSVTLPNSITNIGKLAFNYNLNLTTIIFQGQTPPTTIATDAFYKAHSNLRIHVPKGTSSAYKSKLGHLACRTFELDANGNPQPESKNKIHKNCQNP